MAKSNKVPFSEQIAAFPYNPESWNDTQRAHHETTSLDEAMRIVGGMAGGWYRRPVRIDVQIVGDQEFYSLRPSEIPTPEGWHPVYTVVSHNV